ncbi:hypothetical protein [Streptacidiphilus rugosus]|uniref:hypothetical protein n=1 Tax=Streptacidiphilus rugosus TaxID=405783 RepID=UPI00055E7C5A|nr:hypothetical protein [Streptacidiphilus rugosus]
MNDHSRQPPRHGAEAAMDAAARQLKEEMEIALRHLREQVRGWRAPGVRAAGDEDGDARYRQA